MCPGAGVEPQRGKTEESIETPFKKPCESFTKLLPQRIDLLSPFHPPSRVRQIITDSQPLRWAKGPSAPCLSESSVPSRKKGPARCNASAKSSGLLHVDGVPLGPHLSSSPFSSANAGAASHTSFSHEHSETSRAVGRTDLPVSPQLGPRLHELPRLLAHLQRSKSVPDRSVGRNDPDDILISAPLKLEPHVFGTRKAWLRSVQIRWNPA